MERNKWNHLKVWKNELKLIWKYKSDIYMHKKDLAWNDQQRLICHKAKLNQISHN